MALEVQVYTGEITQVSKGNATHKIIQDVQVNATDAFYMSMSLSLANGATRIAIFDQSGNKVKEVHGSAANQSSCRLAPAASFADTSSGAAIRLALDAATYGVGSKIEIEFAGASNSTTAQVGAYIQVGTSAGVGSVSSYGPVRGVEGNGVMTFTVPFKVVEV
jgi:hypothetical protein